MYRTFLKTSAASHAGEKSVVIGRIIHKLVHKSLSESLLLMMSRLSGRHHGEIGVHAGIPASVPDNAVICLKVFYIVALACRAYKSACAAA